MTPDAAVPRLVIVDDTDPAIRYSPQSAFSLQDGVLLNQAGFGGPVYNNTITGTRTNGSFFTFNFSGEQEKHQKSRIMP